ncbi:MAG: hypothetical protein Tsb0021_11920 [Chlamydiales bacterium]
MENNLLNPSNHKPSEFGLIYKKHASKTPEEYKKKIWDAFYNVNNRIFERFYENYSLIIEPLNEPRHFLVSLALTGYKPSRLDTERKEAIIDCLNSEIGEEVSSFIDSASDQLFVLIMSNMTEQILSWLDDSTLTKILEAIRSSILEFAAKQIQETYSKLILTGIAPKKISGKEFIQYVLEDIIHDILETKVDDKTVSELIKQSEDKNLMREEKETILKRACDSLVEILGNKIFKSLQLPAIAKAGSTIFSTVSTVKSYTSSLWGYIIGGDNNDAIDEIKGSKEEENFLSKSNQELSTNTKNDFFSRGILEFSKAGILKFLAEMMCDSILELRSPERISDARKYFKNSDKEGELKLLLDATTDIVIQKGITYSDSLLPETQKKKYKHLTGAFSAVLANEHCDPLMTQAIGAMQVVLQDLFIAVLFHASKHYEISEEEQEHLLLKVSEKFLTHLPELSKSFISLTRRAAENNFPEGTYRAYSIKILQILGLTSKHPKSMAGDFILESLDQILIDLGKQIHEIDRAFFDLTQGNAALKESEQLTEKYIAFGLTDLIANQLNEVIREILKDKEYIKECVQDIGLDEPAQKVLKKQLDLLIDGGSLEALFNRVEIQENLTNGITGLLSYFMRDRERPFYNIFSRIALIATSVFKESQVETQVFSEREFDLFNETEPRVVVLDSEESIPQSEPVPLTEEEAAALSVQKVKQTLHHHVLDELKGINISESHTPNIYPLVGTLISTVLNQYESQIAILASLFQRLPSRMQELKSINLGDEVNIVSKEVATKIVQSAVEFLDKDEFKKTALQSLNGITNNEELSEWLISEGLKEFNSGDHSELIIQLLDETQAVLQHLFVAVLYNASKHYEINNEEQGQVLLKVSEKFLIHLPVLCKNFLDVTRRAKAENFPKNSYSAYSIKILQMMGLISGNPETPDEKFILSYLDASLIYLGKHIDEFDNTFTKLTRENAALKDSLNQTEKYISSGLTDLISSQLNESILKILKDKEYIKECIKGIGLGDAAQKTLENQLDLLIERENLENLFKRDEIQENLKHGITGLLSYFMSDRERPFKNIFSRMTRVISSVLEASQKKDSLTEGSLITDEQAVAISVNKIKQTLHDHITDELNGMHISKSEMPNMYPLIETVIPSFYEQYEPQFATLASFFQKIPSKISELEALEGGAEISRGCDALAKGLVDSVKGQFNKDRFKEKSLKRLNTITNHEELSRWLLNEGLQELNNSENTEFFNEITSYTQDITKAVVSNILQKNPDLNNPESNLFAEASSQLLGDMNAYLSRYFNNEHLSQEELDAKWEIFLDEQTRTILSVIFPNGKDEILTDENQKVWDSLEKTIKENLSSVLESFANPLERNKMLLEILSDEIEGLHKGMNQTFEKSDYSLDDEAIYTDGQIKEKFVKNLETYITLVLKSTIMNALKSVKIFGDNLSKAIAGNVGFTIKKGIDRVLYFAFITIIGNVLRFLLTPIIYILKRYASYQLHRISVNTVDFISRPEHRELIMTLANTVCNIALNRQPAPRQPLNDEDEIKNYASHIVKIIGLGKGLEKAVRFPMVSRRLKSKFDETVAPNGVAPIQRFLSPDARV